LGKGARKPVNGFDYSAFNEPELWMYSLVNSGKVSLSELKASVTLDEMVKLYALFRMEIDLWS
jgi:hypothetical protein